MDKPDNVELTASTSKLSIHTPGHGSYLNYIRTLVGDLARKVGFPEDDVAKVEMSVDEACSNVVKHAYAPKKAWLWQHRHPEIRLDMQVVDNKVIIEIHDHGQKFDFAAYRPDAIQDRLKDMQTNGYGISIMREFMDEVTYSSCDSTGNTLRLVKYLKKT
ncbi:MAG: ATP-binding protein [Verrucomicrobiota bacterium]